MSRVSDDWIREQEEGWTDPGSWVCSRCIGEDAFLRRLVRKNATANRCTYCRSPRRRAAPLSALMPAILTGIRYSYADEATAGTPMSGEVEVDYVSSEDVVSEMADAEVLEWPDQLRMDIANALTDVGWVHAPDGQWMGEHGHERLAYSWRSFAFEVKHRSRFHFSARSTGRDRYQDVSAHQMLPFLARLVRRHRMLRRVPVGTTLYRVRQGTHSHSTKNLGPPPLDKVSAGRMNPAGIPYFYLATLESTAIAEARVRSGEPATVSEWTLTNDVQVLDLTKLPSAPSVFSGHRNDYDMVHFVYQFVHEISQPVRPDRSEHIEYVPTQVICEYFAQSFSYAKGKRLDGIIYPSAVAAGGQNLVLFPRWGFAEEPEWTKLASLQTSCPVIGP